MGRSIVSKGRNVQEALEMGLRLLGAGHEEYDIEILQNETKGLFGIGMKPATVKISLRDKTSQDAAVRSQIDSSEMNLEELIQTLVLDENHAEIRGSVADSSFSMEFSMEECLGKAWVSGGAVRFLNAPNKFPVIAPDKGVKLIVNGAEQSGNTVIKEGDHVEVDVEQELIEPLWDVRMDGERTEASLVITQPGMKIYRRLKETAPQSMLKLKVEETRIPYSIDEAEVLEKLTAMKIVYGIKYEALSKACRSETSGTFRIAEGDEPLPGKDGFIDSFINIDVKKGFKERSDGTIDFREMMQFPEAEPGLVLGVVMPPVPGKPGKAVTGEIIPPPATYPLQVTVGKGLALMEDQRLVAMESGQPQFKISGRTAKVSVIPKLVIGNDVTMETGNIHYIGDVDIKGSIQDAMLVDANGNVTVMGNVNHAKVTAGQSIYVERNVISCELSAGSDAMLAMEMSGLLAGILDKIKKVIAAIRQLSEVTAFKTSTMSKTGLGPLIKILCEGKLKTLLPSILEYTRKVESGGSKLDEEWHELAEELKQGFIMIGTSTLRNEEDLQRIVLRSERLIEDAMMSKDDKQRFIKASFVHHSSLFSSGDIFIVGQGCYNSKLIAEGAVQVNGYVRGGEIAAKGSVSLDEAGTKGGGMTKIKVPADQSIQMKLALEDTFIQVGPVSYRFLQDTQHVRARLDSKGVLQLH